MYVSKAQPLLLQARLREEGMPSFHGMKPAREYSQQQAASSKTASAATVSASSSQEQPTSNAAQQHPERHAGSERTVRASRERTPRRKKTAPAHYAGNEAPLAPSCRRFYAGSEGGRRGTRSVCRQRAAAGTHAMPCPPDRGRPPRQPRIVG